MAASSTTSKPLAPTLIASAIAILIFWVVTRLMMAWIPSGSNEEAERAAVRAQNLSELQVSDKETLETYGWVDREKGIVRVPIERAMEMVLADLNSRTPAPAYPIVAAPAAPSPEENAAAGPEGTAPPAPQDAAPEAPVPAEEPTAEEPADPAPAEQ